MRSLNSLLHRALSSLLSSRQSSCGLVYQGAGEHVDTSSVALDSYCGRYHTLSREDFLSSLRSNLCCWGHRASFWVVTHMWLHCQSTCVPAPGLPKTERTVTVCSTPSPGWETGEVRLSHSGAPHEGHWLRGSQFLWLLLRSADFSHWREWCNKDEEKIIWSSFLCVSSLRFSGVLHHYTKKHHKSLPYDF